MQSFFNFFKKELRNITGVTEVTPIKKKKAPAVKAKLETRKFSEVDELKLK